MPRRAPIFLLGLCLPARPLPAAEAPEPNPPRVASAAVTAHVLAALPKYQPPVASAPPPPAPASTDEAAPPDPEVVALPKFFVEDSRLRHLDPDKLLGQQALTAKMRRDYRKSLGDLEWTLNCFNIPLLTPSVAARARANYDDRKLAAETARLGDLVDVARRLPKR